MQQQVKSIKSLIQQADFKNAIQQARQALQTVSESHAEVEFHYLLCVALRLSGAFKESLQQADSLLSLNGEYARAYQEKGHAWLSLNEPMQATQNFYQATRFNPALIASWRALCQLYKDLQQSQAENIAQQHLAALSSLPPPLLGAQELIYEGKWQQAEHVCRHFLKQHKHHPEAMLMLAEIGIHMSVLGDAEFLLESCVELYPKNSRARRVYLQLLSKLGKFSQAKQQAVALLEQEPDNVLHKVAKATAMVGVGELPEAIALYQSVLEQDDSLAGVHLLLGHAQKAAGQFGAAVNAYHLACQQQPSFGDAYWSLANTKTYQFTADEIKQMIQQQDQQQLRDDDRVHLCFALGKAFEDQQDYAQSFDYYQRGNQLKQTMVAYDPQATEEQVEQQISHCTAGLFSKYKEQGCKAQDPIFIVGLPRAGSTLLEQILASHSMVDGTMELHNILGLAARLRGHSSRYPGNLHELTADILKRLGEQYISDTQSYRAGAPLFIDKMPNNFLHVGLIKLILPNAKIIDARRHPMACCFSGFKQLFGEGQTFTYSLDNISRYYKSYVKLMDHWTEVLPDEILRVQHEDVINDLEAEVRRMLEFCGLPYEQQCLDFYKTERTIKTPSSEQVRQPIYRSGMEQWRNFEEYLQPLKSGLAD
ncbi:MAG: tetratricopeptide (TPR) repeat protein [Paraglaciecola sp.]|jgi:tetratricopeptide (TPR) repeat protein